MKHFISILTISTCLTLSGCFDILERTYWSDDNYVVWDNPGNPSCKTLYYDLNGAGHGRANYVSQIGSNESFIIVETTKNGEKEYWILNKKEDEPLLNANEIMEGPFDLKMFHVRKEQLEISNLQFDERFE
jgi:hypothetical protein